MSKMRSQYDKELNRNAEKLSYASPKMVKKVADDLGINDGLLYRWRKKYVPEEAKTRYETLKEENKTIKLELVEIKMEWNMSKINCSCTGR